MNSDQRLPLYQQLRDAFATAISNGEWRAGEAIPSESELSRLHSVAIGTVRKAIDQLVAEGVLDRRQGRGTFVKRTRFNASMFRFFRFQSEAGERRIPESRILRREVLQAPSAVASALRIGPNDEVIHLSRLRLIDGTPLLAEDIWLPRARFEKLLGLAEADFGDLLYPLYEECCGEVVTTAEETLTVETADPLKARLLQLQPDAPLIVIERLAFDLTHRPLEWRRSRGAANKFRYHIEIR
ncbi:GntR family transcriptional regulator [Rhodopseudomonas sp. P2A-2r]|nr:GntR family transcriptional regulator [Rhodopseudomonas sp. P2A-2r]